MSIFVDPPALVIWGATIWILAERYEVAKTVVIAACAGMLGIFIIGGIGLYLDWFRWTIPGIVNLKGSFVMVDQGITGFTKATFPPWIVVLFLCFYPFWFAVGFEYAKRHHLAMKVLPYFAIGLLLLLSPSVIEGNFLPHP
ncbi:MAG TPA: hypothetical protein VJR06_01035 [Nitrososphaerales archaeon]|nr:hypothetical protein [Nitrososphaerales archaeon]